MLKRDFIMVQIEELGKVVAQIVTQRNNNAARKIPEMVQVVYDSLKLDQERLLGTPPEELRNYLDGDDGGGLPRLEIAAKLLIEEAWQHPTRQREIREKAKALLEYINHHDTTFSLERIQLINDLNSLLVQE